MHIHIKSRMIGFWAKILCGKKKDKLLLHYIECFTRLILVENFILNG